MTSNSKRILEIEQQIAQLQWQRKQNDRLIQQSLESTKSLKQKDSVIQISVNNLSEKALWQNSVINDELSRPLVLSDQQMNEFLKYERITKEKLQKVKYIYIFIYNTSYDFLMFTLFPIVL